jgi:hypothetical protein
VHSTEHIGTLCVQPFLPLPLRPPLRLSFSSLFASFFPSDLQQCIAFLQSLSRPLYRPAPPSPALPNSLPLLTPCRSASPSPGSLSRSHLDSSTTPLSSCIPAASPEPSSLSSFWQGYSTVARRPSSFPTDSPVLQPTPVNPSARINPPPSSYIVRPCDLLPGQKTRTPRRWLLVPPLFPTAMGRRPGVTDFSLSSGSRTSCWREKRRIRRSLRRSRQNLLHFVVCFPCSFRATVLIAFVW